MQNAGRGIWRKFSGLSRETGGHPKKPVVTSANYCIILKIKTCNTLVLCGRGFL
jgi:hypothetical protein